MTPSQAKILQASEEAAQRRSAREKEKGLREWYRADIQLIFDRVTQTKLNQSKSDKRVSPILFDAILETHRNNLIALETRIKEEAAK